MLQFTLLQSFTSTYFERILFIHLFSIAMKHWIEMFTTSTFTCLHAGINVSYRSVESCWWKEFTSGMKMMYTDVLECKPSVLPVVYLNSLLQAKPILSGLSQIIIICFKQKDTVLLEVKDKIKSKYIYHVGENVCSALLSPHLVFVVMFEHLECCRLGFGKLQ